MNGCIRLFKNVINLKTTMRIALRHINVWLFNLYIVDKMELQ